MRPRGLCPRGCMRLVPGVLVSPACLSPTPTPLRGEPGENTRGAKAAGGIARTGVADARVVDLDAHLVRLGRRHLDVLDGELLARLPRHGRLAGDGLFPPASAVTLFRLGLLRGPARSYAGERGTRALLTFPTVSAIAPVRGLLVGGSGVPKLDGDGGNETLRAGVSAENGLRRRRGRKLRRAQVPRAVFV